MADTKTKEQSEVEQSELEQLKKMLAEQEAKQKEQEARFAELLAKLEAREAQSAEAADTVTVDEEATKAKAEEEERRRYAAWLEEKVPVKLIKLPFSGYSDSVFLSINGESIRIKRGEEVMVKRKFAMLLDQSQMQNDKAIDFMEAEETRYMSDANTRA